MNPADLATTIIDAMVNTRVLMTDPTIAKIKELLADPATKAEDFQRVLPPENIMALMAVSSGGLPKQFPEVLRRELLPLKELVKREFPTLKDSSSFRQAVVNSNQTLNPPSEGLSEIQDVELQPRTITNVSAVPFLVGDKVLNPTTRILMRTSPPGFDLEFFANAEQLSAITAALAIYLAQMLEQRAPLAIKGLAGVADPAEVAVRINGLEQALKKIREFAPTYGISLEPHPQPTPQEDVRPEV